MLWARLLAYVGCLITAFLKFLRRNNETKAYPTSSYRTYPIAFGFPLIIFWLHSSQTTEASLLVFGTQHLVSCC